jgi:hypothetical protein
MGAPSATRLAGRLAAPGCALLDRGWAFADQHTKVATFNNPVVVGCLDKLLRRR